MHSYVTERWIAADISLEASDTIRDITEAAVTAHFTHRECGRTLDMPGFWDGGKSWKIRFAPPECGTWDYTVTAQGKELGLHGQSGSLLCRPYTGDLEIYRRGFVRTEPGKRYFVYDDGTPFFYLGDTHWNMAAEEFDSAGDRAGNLQTDSHFRYIVDKRVSQGFTVYQSEPIGARFNVSDGLITEEDVAGFRDFDRYFAYIASKGLLHTNAQLIFPSAATDSFREHLPELTRYWIARYSAYPVLWTLGQEADDAKNHKIPDLVGMYREMCELLYRQDPYRHPISAHQLNTAAVGCAGGVPVAGVDGGYNDYNPKDNVRAANRVNRASSFRDLPGHSWWAAQWRPCVDQSYNFAMARDYRENGQGKPAVNYEGRYDHLYTKEFGARAQGWISYLSGMVGYGYGGGDMWLYKGRYALDVPGNDGVDTVSVEDKHILWSEMIEAPIGDQMTYLREFFTSFDWHRLEPDFDDNRAFAPSPQTTMYAAAHIGDELYAVYFYSRTKEQPGSLRGMDPAGHYTARWFSPVTGEYTRIGEEIRPDVDGSWTIPEKPLAADTVLLVQKNG